jgi:hypothetical protein
VICLDPLKDWDRGMNSADTINILLLKVGKKVFLFGDSSPLQTRRRDMP